MNDQKVSKNIKIKTEPTLSSTAKKIIISSPFTSSSVIKKEHSTRLPSFKPPRDLLLTGSTTGHSSPNLKDFINSTSKVNKRKYAPNVNVFRKKGCNNSTSNESVAEADTKARYPDHGNKRSPVTNKKRNTNFIQTKGVFSEGLGPGKVKAFSSSYAERTANESNLLQKPKLVLNQKINKDNEDVKLQKILKDDFIDDPDNIPDLTFTPKSLPVINNEKKFFDPNDIEKTFQNLQVKIEKPNTVKNDEIKDEKLELFGAFKETESPRLLLFEFPKVIKSIEEENKKKSGKMQSATEAENKIKLGNLSSAGEGHWGYLRIHENGNAYFAVGTNTIPVSISRHIERQEVMSTSINQSNCKAEILNLGSIDASFTCATNFNDIQ